MQYDIAATAGYPRVVATSQHQAHRAGAGAVDIDPSARTIDYPGNGGAICAATFAMHADIATGAVQPTIKIHTMDRTYAGEIDIAAGHGQITARGMYAIHRGAMPVDVNPRRANRKIATVQTDAAGQPSAHAVKRHAAAAGIDRTVENPHPCAIVRAHTTATHQHIAATRIEVNGGKRNPAGGTTGRAIDQIGLPVHQDIAAHTEQSGITKTDATSPGRAPPRIGIESHIQCAVGCRDGESIAGNTAHRIHRQRETRRVVRINLCGVELDICV